MERFRCGGSGRPRRHHRSAKSLGLRLKSAAKSLCCISVHCEIDRHDREDLAPTVTLHLPTLPSSRIQSSRHYRGVGTPFKVRLRTLVRGFQPEHVPTSELQPGQHEDSDDEVIADPVIHGRSSTSPDRLPTYGDRRAHVHTIQEASEAAPKISLTTPTTLNISAAEYTAKTRERMMYDEHGKVREGLVVPQQLIRAGKLRRDGRDTRTAYFADEEPGWVRERKTPRTPLTARTPTVYREEDFGHEMDLDLDPLSLYDEEGPSADQCQYAVGGSSLFGTGGSGKSGQTAERDAENIEHGEETSGRELEQETETKEDANSNKDSDPDGDREAVELAGRNEGDSDEDTQDQKERGRAFGRSSSGSENRGGSNTDESDSWKRRVGAGL